MLQNAGVAFEAISSAVDERALERELLAAGASPGAVALALAEAKARAIPAEREAFVIGADQTLEAAGERWHKPTDCDEARRQIAALSGRSHQLHSAVVGLRPGYPPWRHLATATLTMRKLKAEEVEAYLDQAGAAATASVGAYQIEGPGIQLFETIEGDYFTILGLPLLPLLKWLREAGALAP